MSGSLVLDMGIKWRRECCAQISWEFPKSPCGKHGQNSASSRRAQPVASSSKFGSMKHCSGQCLFLLLRQPTQHVVKDSFKVQPILFLAKVSLCFSSPGASSWNYGRGRGDCKEDIGDLLLQLRGACFHTLCDSRFKDPTGFSYPWVSTPAIHL